MLTERIYQEILVAFDERLNVPLSAIVYMTELINTLIEKTGRTEEIFDQMAAIYGMTVHFYHHNDKWKIEFICDHAHQVLD